MRVLLVYPRYPDTFWSFRHALKVAGKKASFPPLGLLTVAAMLPDEWDKKLVDMNVKPLRDDDIKWADYVFISAMVVQRDSVADVIERCKRYNTIMVLRYILCLMTKISSRLKAPAIIGQPSMSQCRIRSTLL